MDIIITYDIAETDGDGARRLRAVAAACESFGVRAQYSVFECRVSETTLERLVADLRTLIDPSTDSVHIYRLSGPVESARRSLGIVKHHPVDKTWIF